MKRHSISSVGYLTVGTLAALSFASVASAGALYVYDGNNIFKYGVPAGSSTNSTFSSTALTPDDGIAFSPSDVLYAAISSGIYSYSPSGVASLYAAAANPTGIAIDSNGDVFTGATVGTNTVLEEFLPNDLTHPTVLTPGAIVDSLTIDSNGNLFEADDTGIVYEYKNGTSGLGPATALNLSHLPGNNYFGILVDNSGNVYVSYQSTTSLGGGIDEITASGSVVPFVTYAGTSVQTDTSPEGLAYDPSTNSIFMT